MTLALQHHRFTVAAYDEMVAHGILTPDDRVELLAGYILEKSPTGSRHAACVDRLTRYFVIALGDRAIVRIQGAVVLPPDSEPEPDVAILRPRDDFYADAHPRPDDILLLIEVTESTLEYDRSIKLPLYAAAGIREYWIVDVVAATIERSTAPRDGAYTTSATLRGDDVIPVPGFSEIRLRVRDVVPAGAKDA